MKRTLVINLFGGPGTGKSSIMAGVFSYLKFRGVNCEMAPEFAKEKVWEESFRVLDNQLYVFAKQHHTVARLINKVDLIVTDSPLLLSLHYGKDCSDFFKNLVLNEHNKVRSINIFLVRKKKYNPKGRMQTLKEAKKIDKSLLDLLERYSIKFHTVEAVEESIKVIGDMCLKTLKDLKKRKK